MIKAGSVFKCPLCGCRAYVALRNVFDGESFPNEGQIARLVGESQIETRDGDEIRCSGCGCGFNHFNDPKEWRMIS